MELEDLFVEPRRMRQGVARRLVEDVLSLARILGVGAVWVTANAHAMAFYTSVGFVPDGAAHTRFGPAPRMRLDVASYRRCGHARTRSAHTLMPPPAWSRLGSAQGLSGSVGSRNRVTLRTRGEPAGFGRVAAPAMAAAIRRANRSRRTLSRSSASSSRTPDEPSVSGR